MNLSYPVFTVETECQDCYKCVRHCPVKAISVRNGHATVIPELCVACGKCVEVCPVKAKRVRSDVPQVKALLAEKTPVYLSIAPSWVSEFQNVKPGAMIRTLKKLGFSGVSETAIGAQLVSYSLAKELDARRNGLFISSACPTSVDYIRRYLPHLAPYITEVGSPLMAHCRFLRDNFGDSIRIVFAGPCISKKNEADRRSELLDFALTYPELRQLFRDADLDPLREESGEDAVFVPFSAEEGARYPIAGGMNDTLRFHARNRHIQYVAVSGLDQIKLALNGLEKPPENDVVFLELLACPGGCVHGPGTEHNSPGVLELLRVLDSTRFPEKPEARKTSGSIHSEFTADVPDEGEPANDKLTEALRRVGKNTPEDELNCDGCGYDTCRNFARAMLAGRAEPSMCVSYLRKQAQKKANALLRSIPSGVVIVDKDMRLIECNRVFAALFGEDIVELFDASPGLAGADLRRIVPFHALFEAALQSGGDVQRDSLKSGKHLFNVNIFTIEPNEVVGAVLFDVTNTEFRREQIARRAKQVIDKNLAAVQEIACRLGEQMADTELLLRSIVDTYSDETESADAKDRRNDR